MHRADGESPMRRLLVSPSCHYTLVTDGIVHNSPDQQWPACCVNGYWVLRLPDSGVVGSRWVWTSSHTKIPAPPTVNHLLHSNSCPPLIILRN